MLIDIRCKHCQKLHCRISRNFFGVIEFKCDKCKQLQTISLALTMRPTKPRVNAGGRVT